MKKSVQIGGKIDVFFSTKNKKCRVEKCIFYFGTPLTLKKFHKRLRSQPEQLLLQNEAVISDLKNLKYPQNPDDSPPEISDELVPKATICQKF